MAEPLLEQGAEAAPRAPLRPGELLSTTLRAFSLVWTTSRTLTFWLALFTLVSGAFPSAVAYFSKLIVDSVLAATASGSSEDRRLALLFVVAEAGLVVFLALSSRGAGLVQSLLRAEMGHRVNVMILEKALSLPLRRFEDSEFYDKLTRARREASSRPLGLVTTAFRLVQNLIVLGTCAAVLLSFSPLASLALALSGIPPFVSELKFSGAAFRLFTWRSPEARMQSYLETLMAREDYAKEVQLFRLGPVLLERYCGIFDRLYAEDRRLTIRRNAWGYLLGLAGTSAFYAAYVWIAYGAIQGTISLGEMTMYALLFKQGQGAVSSILSGIGSVYEHKLYISTLDEFLEQDVKRAAPGDATGSATGGPDPTDGIRFEGVSFTYPGAREPALHGIDLHLRPGGKLALVGENGAGKTTLIKLLTRLYEPTGGRITLDGLDLAAWDEEALRRRFAVIFQDYARYQLLAGENIGAGDVDHFEDESRWRRAAEKGMADSLAAELPRGLRTQLGRWFKDGHELSGGQWQKIALSRLFMRESADILILDEPTASMDADAEYRVFQRFRSLADSQIAIVISHRFSTVRMADEIVVLERGRIMERGSHAELLEGGGEYARLFRLQAEGYR